MSLQITQVSLFPVH